MMWGTGPAGVVNGSPGVNAWGPMWMGGSVLMMAVVWGLIILVGVVLVRTLANSGGSHSADDLPLNVLKRRFASGEINQEDFERMRSVLASADR